MQCKTVKYSRSSKHYNIQSVEPGKMGGEVDTRLLLDQEILARYTQYSSQYDDELMHI
jgi:hypothetical protein